MCISSPKIPDPPPPPAPPPPPTETAKRAGNTALKSRRKTTKRGPSALTIRRPSINTGSSGTGANINY